MFSAKFGITVLKRVHCAAQYVFGFNKFQNQILLNKISLVYFDNIFTVYYAIFMHMRFAEIRLNMEYFDIYDMNIFVCIFNELLQIN